MRILVIEDNSDIAANLGDYLEDRDHVVDFAADGITGLHLAVVNDFDAIVLDLNLPGMDGLEVCRKLRNDARKTTPILMLTARDALEQKLTGFDAGADDYLVKPFALQEVEARLTVLARRGRGSPARILDVSDLHFNLDTLEVSRAGKSINLNPTALKILQCLMESSPNVVTRQELETVVWGEELPDSDSLRVHIHGLRALLDKPF
ncbi:MAG: response regulator transcription factor, partial [Aquimonas sp.]|nr:response regulator transcription factor [Aquimonas sp.]